MLPETKGGMHRLHAAWLRDNDAMVFPLPQKSQSPWLIGTTSAAPTHPALDGDLTVDVAVIGAGITGLSSALALQREGLRVAVVERDHVGAGTTGHTTAKLSSLQGLKYTRLASRRGNETARAYATLNEQAIREIHRLVEGFGIDCDYRVQSNYTYAESPDELKRIESEVDAAGEAGLPVEYVDDVPLPFEVAGAVRLDGQAEFHPVRFLSGLSKAFIRAGGRIFERTQAVKLHDGEPCRVDTDRGRITADKAIVATQFPFPDRALFFARIHPERSYALGARIEGAPPPGMFINAGSPVRSIRSHPFGPEELLLIGGEGHKVGQGGSTAARYERLRDFAVENFAVRSIDYRWSTQDNLSVDEAPYVGRLTPRSRALFVATGFGKWGLAMGVASAAILTDGVLERESPLGSLLDPNRIPSRRSAIEMAVENTNVAFHFIGDRLTKRAPLEADNLAPGRGKVVANGRRQLAISKGRDGTVQVVSARCTHLGCIVEWNDAERSWDCPCHGSRFGPGGEVLNGPAVRPLDPQPIE
jgi:glycine/D-amino acid oxidase-like deaminating enzyme/nitrite reductase/ring-hydroxylating ferredoxin subunit